MRLADMTRSQMSVRIMRLQQELEAEMEEVERLQKLLQEISDDVDTLQDAVYVARKGLK